MTFVSILCLAATMTSSDAIVILLNSRAATSPTRYAEAEALVLKEAKAGRTLQQYVVGVTTKDETLAAKYLDASRAKIQKLADEHDNSLAWYLLSMEKNDLKLLRYAAERGNVQALNAYGSILIQSAFDKNISSNKLEVALAEGYKCFSRAAAMKDPNGYINLGTCYLRGFGCPVDHMLAHQCFLSAAEAGHPEGMDYLSASYEMGHGVKRNAELALFWRMKAKAVRGDKAAEEWLKK